MIKILLKNGKVYENNPETGVQLHSKEEIENCLRNGFYMVQLPGETKHLRLYPKDVRGIIEEH